MSVIITVVRGIAFQWLNVVSSRSNILLVYEPSVSDTPSMEVRTDQHITSQTVFNELRTLVRVREWRQLQRRDEAAGVVRVPLTVSMSQLALNRDSFTDNEEKPIRYVINSMGAQLFLLAKYHHPTWNDAVTNVSYRWVIQLNFRETTTTDDIYWSVLRRTDDFSPYEFDFNVDSTFPNLFLVSQPMTADHYASDTNGIRSMSTLAQYNVWSVLTNFMDSSTKFAFVSTLFLVLSFFLFYRKMLQSRKRKPKSNAARPRRVIERASVQASVVINYLTVAFGFLIGQWMFDMFRLLNRLKRGHSKSVRLTLSVAFYTVLFASFLYQQFVCNEILAYTIRTPLIYVDSFEDFTRLRSRYDLKLIAYEAYHPVNYLQELYQIPDHYWNMIKDFVTLVTDYKVFLNAFPPRNVVRLNSGYNCDYLKYYNLVLSKKQRNEKVKALQFIC